MTDTPKWMMEAAREIVKALSKEILCYGTADKTPATKAETTALRIISIHCPEDRGEKLLEACKMALGFPTASTIDRKGTKWDHPDNKPDQPEIIRNLRAAITEYEE